MRVSFLLPAAMLAILPLLARADVPPPPDEYSGPPVAHLAGLTFEHQRIRTSFDLGSGHLVPGAYMTYVLLTGCEATHANCTAAKKLGVIGGAVVAVDGKDPAGDIGIVQAAFDKAHRRHVVLTMLSPQDTNVENEHPKTVAFAVAGR